MKNSPPRWHLLMMRIQRVGKSPDVEAFFRVEFWRVEYATIASVEVLQS